VVTLGTLNGRARHAPLTRLAFLSIAAAVITMGLKFGAYLLTGSVGLLSDAVESSANLVAAVTALFALWYAARPVDRSHPYGHGKIEFFASGVEGGLVLVAAGAIAWYGIQRLISPRPLEALGIGMAVSLVATAINFAVARVFLRVARERGSLVLEADGRHLMTDVWTSLGVIVAVTLVRLTGQNWIDPAIALLVAANIAWTGFDLLRKSFDGLMDRALPEETRQAIRAAIEAELPPGATYHALRTRQSGGQRFADFHLLVPGNMPVREAHRLAERIEKAIARVVPGTETTIHFEPVEEPAAWQDTAKVLLARE
jgi:cation diffusion facilitator family transporter